MKHVSKFKYTLLFFFCVSLVSAFAAKNKVPVWTDPEQAEEEHEDFIIQGEYLGHIAGKEGKKSKFGIQVTALDNGAFLASVFKDGLPGQKGVSVRDRQVFLGQRTIDNEFSFNHEKITKITIEDELMLAFDAEDRELGRFERIIRKSPTLGANVPKGAKVLFDGKGINAFKGSEKVPGQLKVGSVTKHKYGAFHLHLEFMLPFKPSRAPSNQDRGNSGIYIYNNYEVQLLDSFGLHYYGVYNWEKEFLDECGFKPQSNRSQWLSCLYKFKTPQFNMAYPPLQWQTYDIHFTPAVFKEGKKTAHARITVFLNGIKVQDDVELTEGGTGMGRSRKEREKGEIHIQNHGNPVQFKNIWILEK